MTAPFVGANAPRTGRGRPTGRKPRVPDVETLACGGRAEGTHELRNDDGATCCRFCGRAWGELDAEARG